MTEHPTPPPHMTSHKAVIAAVVGFLASLAGTLQGRTDLHTMGLVDWLIILASAAVAGGTVYAIPNRVKGAGRRPRRRVR